MSLKEQLEGVELDPPTNEVDDNLDPDPVVEPDPNPDADPEGDDKGGKGKGEGRTADNVHGELSRKMAERDEANKKFQTKVLGALDSLAKRVTEPAQSEPDKTNGDPLANHTVAQLKELRAKVPEEKLVAYDEYVVERKIQDEIESRMSISEQARDAQHARKTATKEAVSLYPDLVDENSDFAVAVDKELRMRGKTYTDGNPHALLDVANGVAQQLRVVQRTANPNLPKNQPNPRRHTAPAGDKDELSQSRERASEIASGLQGALPKGKKFDLKRMRENSEDYIKNADLYIR